MSVPLSEIHDAITNIYCSRTSKTHLLGAVAADAAGLVLTYSSAVHTAPTDVRAVRSPQDGMTYLRDGSPAEYRLSRNESTQVDVWCRSCRTGHPVDTLALFRATAEQRRESVTLTSRGAWDGLWQ